MEPTEIVLIFLLFGSFGIAALLMLARHNRRVRRESEEAAFWSEKKYK